METKSQILDRLADCRATYQQKNTQKQLDLLLENTMVAIQDLLHIEGLPWEDKVKAEE